MPSTERSSHGPFLLSSLLFGSTALYAWWKQPKNNNQSATEGSSTSLVDSRWIVHRQLPPGRTSSRGRNRLLTGLPLYQHDAVQVTPFDATHNPTGWISLFDSSNNNIGGHRLARRSLPPSMWEASFLEKSPLPLARQAAAYFCAQRFVMAQQQWLDPQTALECVSPDCIAVVGSHSEALGKLMLSLGEAGQGVLVPAPYPLEWESTIQQMAGMHIIPIAIVNPQRGPTLSELEVAFLQGRAAGHEPSVLLVSHPQKPWGMVYQEQNQVMMDLITWSRKRKLHTVVDESLGLVSLFEGSFTSVLQLLNNDLQDNVHWMYSVSQDFGASGLPYGLVYSQNAALVEILNHHTIPPAAPLQLYWSELLTDNAFVDDFLDHVHTELAEHHQACLEKLHEMVVPCLPVQAGTCCVVDLTGFLRASAASSSSWQQEDDAAATKSLYHSMVQYARVIFLLPQACWGGGGRVLSPGLFVLHVHANGMEVALERLSRFLAKLRRLDVSDMNELTMSGIII